MQGSCTAEGSTECRLAKDTHQFASVSHVFLFTFGVVHPEHFQVRGGKFGQCLKLKLKKLKNLVEKGFSASFSKNVA